MNFKMPKPAYRIILGVSLLSFVVASCDNNKSSKEKETIDTIKVKPVDPGNLNEPVDPGNNRPDTMPDTIKTKPVDPGN